MHTNTFDFTRFPNRLKTKKKSVRPEVRGTTDFNGGA